MGKAKEQVKPPEGPSGVDMARIKKMMGPLPDEQKIPDIVSPEPTEIIEPTTAPEVPKANQDISDAAEEANETLKAMAADLETTKRVPLDEVLAEESELTDEGVVADDAATISAVEDIVSREGDEVLEAEDEARGAEDVEAPKGKFKQWIRDLWAKPAARWAIIGGLIALVIAAAVLPTSRYFILNNVGVRGSMSVTIVDNGTQLPLKNASVAVAGITAQTDDSGKATLQHVKLGAHSLVISKRAFKETSQKVTLGWGSNPLGQFSLSASGEQYTFFVTDYLSGKSIEKAQATSGAGNAIADKNGKITLALDTSGKADSDEISVAITLAGYRDETVKITANTKSATKVKLVPGRKDVFVSNRSGKYDVYTIDIDGRNEKKIVSGTGIERSDIALAPLQNSDTAAYVATRENVKNQDGFLLSTLYMLDVTNGSLSKIEQSEQIQLVGWSNDGRLIYVKIAAGTSAGNTKRVRLMSLNSKNTSDNKELASANYFNDVVMAGNRILYAPVNALQDSKPGLYAINSDGSGALTITNKEVYNIFRTDSTTVTVRTPDNYYTYTIGGTAASFAVTTAPKQTNVLYVDNQSGTQSLWSDTRDGKGVLFAYDKGIKKDKTLVTIGGLGLPISWLTDTVAIYRISDGKQTADYVVSTEGGEPQKITDLTNVGGISRWYYY